MPTRFVPAGKAIVLLAFYVAGCGAESHAYRVGEAAAEPKGYERAYEEAGGPHALGTPTSAVELWGFGCRQVYKGGRSKTAVLLQDPCGDNQQVFAVTDEFFATYRSAGEEAPVKYGFPMGPRSEWMGGFTQGFGRGGAVETLFMQRPGAPPYVLSRPVLEYYLSFPDRDVRLGYPTSDGSTRADGTLCQQFEHGSINGGADWRNLSVTAPPSECRESPNGR